MIHFDDYNNEQLELELKDVICRALWLLVKNLKKPGALTREDKHERERILDKLEGLME